MIFGIKFKIRTANKNKKYVPSELSYDVLRKQGYNERINQKSLTGENNSSLINLQILNRLKVFELKNKIKNNKKIEFVFYLIL